MLDREHLTGTRNAALHFVGNQHDAVLIAHAPQSAQELERRNVESALALHRFDENGGDRLRVYIAVEESLQVGERLLGRDVAIGLRKLGVIDLGRKRSEPPLVRHDLAGERQGHERASVKAAGEGDHRRTLGVIARDLDGVLHRLRTGRQKHRFFGEIPGGESVQPLRQPHVRFIGRHVKTGVCKGFRLLRNGRHHPRVTVSGVEYRDPGGKIDIAPAVDVPQLRVFGPGHIDALATDAVGHGSGFASLEFRRFGHCRSP